MLQERFLGDEGPIANLGSGLTTTLAGLTQLARSTKVWGGMGEPYHPLGRNQVCKFLFKQVSEDGRGMITRAQVAQRV